LDHFLGGKSINSDLDVSMFLVSSGVDWVRKGAAEGAHLNPFDPSMKEMIQKVIDNGCTIMVCPPCAKARGYSQEDFLDNVVITGSGAMHELIKQGAATLSF
jgi:predicted peroxiredoxin